MNHNNDVPSADPSLIRDLDLLIQQRGSGTELTELYCLTLGIAVYRLQSIIGKSATKDLLMNVIEGLSDIPPPNLKAMN